MLVFELVVQLVGLGFWWSAWFLVVAARLWTVSPCLSSLSLSWLRVLLLQASFSFFARVCLLGLLALVLACCFLGLPLWPLFFFFYPKEHGLVDRGHCTCCLTLVHWCCSYLELLACRSSGRLHESAGWSRMDESPRNLRPGQGRGVVPSLSTHPWMTATCWI